jgi:hypothetical protein
MAKITAPYIEVSQKKKFLLTTIRASVLTKIAYVAVRGKTKERGAIQRLLNTRRISSIKEFTEAGGGISELHRPKLGEYPEQDHADKNASHV